MASVEAGDSELPQTAACPSCKEKMNRDNEKTFPEICLVCGEELPERMGILTCPECGECRKTLPSGKLAIFCPCRYNFNTRSFHKGMIIKHIVWCTIKAVSENLPQICHCNFTHKAVVFSELLKLKLITALYVLWSTFYIPAHQLIIFVFFYVPNLLIPAAETLDNTRILCELEPKNGLLQWMRCRLTARMCSLSIFA